MILRRLPTLALLCALGAIIPAPLLAQEDSGIAIDHAAPAPVPLAPTPAAPKAATVVSAPPKAPSAASTPLPAAIAQPAPTPPDTVPPAATASDTPPDIDPHRFAAAQELVKSFDMKTLLQGVMGVMTKAMVPLIDQDNPGQGEKTEQIASDSVQKVVMGHLPDLEKNKAVVYAQLFSLPELQQLTKFYQSPLGRKMLQSTPEMMRRNAILDQSIMLSAVHEARKQIAQELKKNGMKVPKALGV